jgi:hypothetical protein
MTNTVAIANLLWALSQLESGGNDQAHGRHGELGRFQPLPATWREATNAPFSQATNPSTASAVVLNVIETRTKQNAPELNPARFAIAWHCPAKLDGGKLTAEQRDYIQRFVNLYQVRTQPATK